MEPGEQGKGFVILAGVLGAFAPALLNRHENPAKKVVRVAMGCIAVVVFTPVIPVSFPKLQVEWVGIAAFFIGLSGMAITSAALRFLEKKSPEIVEAGFNRASQVIDAAIGAEKHEPKEEKADNKGEGE